MLKLLFLVVLGLLAGGVAHATDIVDSLGVIDAASITTPVKAAAVSGMNIGLGVGLIILAAYLLWRVARHFMGGR